MKLAAALCLALICGQAGAQVIDDSDLGGDRAADAAIGHLSRESRPDAGLRIFPLTASISMAQNGSVTGVFYPRARVRLIGPGAPARWFDTDASGRFSIAAKGLIGSYKLHVSLDNALWRFRDASDNAYAWELGGLRLAGAGADMGAIAPIRGSENAKLGVLHATYLEALGYLSAHGDLDWWDETLEIKWPGSANFFSPGSWSLELTDALAWDVVLHELGHAVMHGAMNASPAGGAHKIDECYSEALAWSEGWATFFAAAVRLSPADPDARFEFLVPRRVPIRIENVPPGVCQGQTNEWRVAAGLWDLLDTHHDGKDRFSMPFEVLWSGLRGQSMGSLSGGWALIAKPLNPAERRAGEEALIGNTLLPPRSAPSAAVSAPVF